MKNSSDVAFEEISGRDGHLGLITLTRPTALNALSQPMINAIDQQLIEWESANHIKAVVIRAVEGRAFCAGGDVRSVYERKLANDPRIADFFRDEYSMNRRIHNYLKPFIALLDGITMGGGVGVSVHASHRVATDRLLFAMPETGIGFYPDVGTTYTLSRLPHQMGYFLGLTGARLTLNDCIAIGLVDYAVTPAQFPELIYALADTQFGEDERTAVTQTIKKMAVPTGESILWERRETIEECFSKKTIESILAALEKNSAAWCQEMANLLKKKSPSSLKVTLRALQQAAELDFNEAIQIEFRLTNHFLAEHDFFEGVRAVLIDKDQSPHWRPAKLKEVTNADVEKYFASLEVELG